LHLAKLEKGKMKLKIHEGNLGLFLGMLATSFEYRASQKNMEYDIHIDTLESAYYDEDALEKIVTNLPPMPSNTVAMEEYAGSRQLKKRESCKSM